MMRTCPCGCGRQFEPQRRGQVYFDRECYLNDVRAVRAQGTCEVCGEAVPASRPNGDPTPPGQRTCSRKCGAILGGKLSAAIKRGDGEQAEGVITVLALRSWVEIEWMDPDHGW